jgi:hypothetical protein
MAGILAAAAALALGSVAQAAPPEPNVPIDIRVSDDNKLFLVGHAVGVQIYTCTVTASGLSWGPAVPRAELSDDSGKPIISHFGGPTWQAKDGSKVVAGRDGVLNVANAIPWLRLKATSTSAGPDGDRLEGTTYIQRIATTGGVAPAPSECNVATVGTQAEVGYTADYYFWKARGS